MKQKTTRFLGVLAAAIFALGIAEANAADFTYTYENVTLSYQIVDATNRYVAVVPGSSITGNYLIIPEQVEYNGLTYTVTELHYAVISTSNQLSSIMLPNTLRLIEHEAIVQTNITGITALTIPENVDTIGYNGIKLKGLKTLTWKARNCKLNPNWMYVYDSYAPEEIVFGKEVKKVPDYFCRNNGNLSSIVVPVNVDSIGNYAFFSCTDLSSVALGESVKSIGEFAFYNCQKLNYILCAPAVPPVVPTHAFHDVPLDATIEVPCNTIAAYAAANEWKNFWAFEETILYKAIGRVMDEEQGSVEVEQDCRCATFTAMPAEGYRFKQWSNGSKTNPLTLQLSESVELVAEFEEMPAGLEEIFNLNTPSDGKFIRNGQLLIIRNGLTYNAQGNLVE